MHSYYSHGKLLLTAEYAVLKGAKGLAIPCKRGQILDVKPQPSDYLSWKSFDVNKALWFSATFLLPSFSIVECSEVSITERLSDILKAAKKQNEHFLTQGAIVETHLEFDRNWGLGSSSTLISNIALWAGVNPYKLLEQSFGGSGYDLACAQLETPLLYTRKGVQPLVESVAFDPPFKKDLFFVHLNKKQNSLKAINALNWDTIDQKLISEINYITEKIVKCTDHSVFNTLLLDNEKIIGALLQQNPAQKLLFPDYMGAIKSLGAWGGDFILASGNQKTPNYFHEKGFKTVISYSEMIFGS